MRVRTMLAGLLAGLPVALLAPAAQAFDHISVPAAVEVAEHRLVLNGTGKRSFLFIDAYTASLYLPRKSHDLAYVINDATAVAVRIDVHGAPPTPMPAEWRVLLKEELSNRLFRRMKRTYRDIEGGDRLEITYAPGAGTTIRVNGEKVLNDPGHGLMEGLLHFWVGDDAVSEALQQALLARSDA